MLELSLKQIMISDIVKLIQAWFKLFDMWAATVLFRLDIITNTQKESGRRENSILHTIIFIVQQFESSLSKRRLQVSQLNALYIKWIVTEDSTFPTVFF